MSDSLREQLLKAGFTPSRTQEKREPRGKAAQARNEKPGPAQQKRSDDVDLARAYAVRAQAEKCERDQAQREAQRLAQERRERKRKVQELLADNVVAVAADAECVRHFEHKGKIRRIHVDAAQLAALNKGELGVVVQGGRFMLVAREVALRARAIAEDTVALLVDPDAPTDTSDDGVPDDLMW